MKLPERGATAVNLSIELEQESDGRWITEVPDLPGVLTYGASREEALAHVQALALRVLAERLEHGETAADSFSVVFRAA
jgi:predicted RNase H-like HicB family nuclease